MTDPRLGPGVYDDISADVYHGACTQQPALSSTGARALMQRCPAYHRYRDPHLNPLHQPKHKRQFDIGTAAHVLFLEPKVWDERCVVIEAPDYKTKAARELRDAAYDAGKTPLLSAEAAMLQQMRDALDANPMSRHAVRNVDIERTVVWVDPETGCWCKARPDIWPRSGTYLIDYKSTTSAAPRDCERAVANYGHHVQAAWYCDAVEAATGVRPRRFAFVFQEKEPPYLVTVGWLTVEALDWGHIVARKARDVYATCLRAGNWPGYADKAIQLGLPGWETRELERHHEEGRFLVSPTPTQADYAFAVAAQAPLDAPLGAMR